MKKNYAWLKFKKYPHIGKPLNRKKDSKWILEYVTNPEKISKHKFTPLLNRNISQRKFRPLDNAPKNKYGKRVRTLKDNKIRRIFYPSHLDSIIYSYYNFLLADCYEFFLRNQSFKDVPIAYRKIPKETQEGNKSNIEFAYEAFNYIENNKYRKLSIIIADISSFFDNLNHRLLHSQWKKVLNTDNLPNDHYSVYKSLINFSYVNERAIYNRFKHKLFVERYMHNDSLTKNIKRKRVKQFYNMRKENVVAFCTKKEFFKEGVDLIHHDKPNNRELRKTPKKGIPQGTPLSATLANIYMIDFDEKINKESQVRNAFFQRYSDDLIIICDQNQEDYFYNLIINNIENSHLEIQDKKTKIYRYEYDLNHIFKGGLLKDETVTQNEQITYLGFQYDGTKVRVKTSSFSKFYRTMKRSFRRGSYFAKKDYLLSNDLFETKLYKRFTHLGAKRFRKWEADKSQESGFRQTDKINWGNFISYLNKSNDVMKPINKDDTIKRQYRKVWKNFHKIKEKTYEKIELHNKSASIIINEKDK